MKNYYTKKSFEDNNKTIASDELVNYIRSMKGKVKQMILSEETGISQCHISAIQNYKFRKVEQL